MDLDSLLVESFFSSVVEDLASVLDSDFSSVVLFSDVAASELSSDALVVELLALVLLDASS